MTIEIREATEEDFINWEELERRHKADYTRIPERTIETIKMYVEDGAIPGSFVEAVLCNDLKGAFSCADVYNRIAMYDIVHYLYNKVPSVCWGSSDIYYDWINRKRLERNGEDEGE